MFFVLVLLLLLTFFGISFRMISQNDQLLRRVIASRSELLTENNEAFQTVFTEIFPSAHSCFEQENSEACKPHIRMQLDQTLHEALSYQYPRQHAQPEQRLPVYFVRLLDENTLEKLYQDGTYTQKIINTPQEKYGAQILLGQKETFAFPQYTCCGGDDFVPHIPVIGWLLPPRRYFQDFPAETELIFPVIIQREVTGGAVVYLHGD